MNKIFKKVFNRSRGVFVAVSEAMTAASQTGGKLAIVVLGSLALHTSALALTTFNGDTATTQFPQDEGPRLADSVIVNGNLVHHPNSDGWFLVAVTDRHYGYADNTLTVNGNFSTDQDSSFTVSHNRKSGDEVRGKLFVNGNAFINGTLTNGSISDYHDGSIDTYIKIRDTLTVGTTGFFGDDSRAVRIKSTVEVGSLVNHGTVSFANGGTAYSTYGSVTNYGNFQQPSNNTVRVNGSFIQHSGLLNTTAPEIIVGGTGSMMSIGGSLILNGGSLSGPASLRQKANEFRINGGNFALNVLNKENGSFVNAGTFSVSNFNQSNGTTSNSGNLTIGNANLYGSLTNTGTLSLTGTVTSRGNLTSSGTLNNRGSWTETAHYAISGNLNNSGAVNFQNGFVFASNGRLNSSGTLQTNNAANIFDSLGRQGQTALSTVSLEAVLPEETKTALTDLFRHYVPGTVAQSLIDHASFTGGKVIVTGVNLTATQRDDLVQAFKAKFFLLFPNVSTSAVSQQC
ncbi:ESPR-type extended signal peptide-containing protein [Parasutterella excrementihominis]|uniref:ESPR-type extended signal peptide-containing protein n=1 Tax=Parasutterella excrementihominis TaxID=487175 RepID=UPI003A9279B5